jgi:hypothetical protein
MLRRVRKGPLPEEFDVKGKGSVDLISVDEKEGEQWVRLSYLVPTVYTPLERPGWKNLAIKDEVATP